MKRLILIVLFVVLGVSPVAAEKVYVLTLYTYEKNLEDYRLDFYFSSQHA